MNNDFLKKQADKKQAETAAAPFSSPNPNSGAVHAFCQQSGVGEPIRVVADLERRIVTPLLRPNT